MRATGATIRSMIPTRMPTRIPLIPRRIPTGMPAATLLVVLLVSACTTDAAPEAGADAGGSPGASSSPSSPSPPAADASETRAAEPVPPPPRGRNDRASAREFAQYTLQAWIHALNTNDPRALLEAGGSRPCAGCAELRRELSQRERQGWYVALRGVRVTSAEATVTGRTARAQLAVDIPESETREEDGTFRSTNPAHPASIFEVEMTHTGARYRLTAFRLYDERGR